MVGDADHDGSHSSVEFQNVENENLSRPTSSTITAAAIIWQMMTAFITMKAAAMTQQIMSRTSITVTAMMTHARPPWMKKTFARKP